MTTSATPPTVMWRAFTTMPVGEVSCSLITIWPPGMETVWFGAPLTGTGAPLSRRLLTLEEPAPPPFRIAEARDVRRSAPMVLPAMLADWPLRQELRRRSSDAALAL